MVTPVSVYFSRDGLSDGGDATGVPENETMDKFFSLQVNGPIGAAGAFESPLGRAVYRNGSGCTGGPRKRFSWY